MVVRLRIGLCVNLVLIFKFALASYHDLYRVPDVSTNSWESYLYNDKEYIVHNLPTRWEDATIICRGRHNGSLAILDTVEKADFMAETLSESQFRIDSIWVGARRLSAEDPEGYRWTAGSKGELKRTANDVIEYKEEQEEPFSNHYPSWLNRTHVPVPEGGADCVGLTRMYHDKPMFLDLPCEVERPFVCEKEASGTQARVSELATVRCKTGLYHIYDGMMNWDQAAAHCVLSKMTLAHIVTMRCLRKLGMTMLRSRPSIENAWIGARGDLGKWKWLDDGKSIFTPSPLIDVDPSKWPPIRDRKNVKATGCLQLDRHTSHMPVFLEARCERKMQFICYESKEGIQSLRSSTEPPSDDFFFYILVQQKLLWSHAFENCQKMNGVLATLDSAEILTQLLLLMGENKDMPIGHIWVSGRLNLTKDMRSDAVKYEWYNPTNGRIIPEKRSDGSELYVPPWLDEELNTENSCLNLDRENHLSGLVYGLPCDTAQYSICMIDKGLLNKSRTGSLNLTAGSENVILNEPEPIV